MSVRGKILVIDDEETIRFSLKTVLASEGYHVFLADTAEKGLEIMEKEYPQLVFLDLRLQGQDGLSALKEISREFDDAAVVIITAYGDTKSTVKAIKEGAYDYINKPFELDEILLLADKVFESRSLQKQAALFQYQQKNRLSNRTFICASQIMAEIIEEIKKVAVTDATVLLQGETGTGKEMAARMIHSYSDRKDKPFIDINCGALPFNLVESELFGFEKNAFTGAASAKKGLFELADGGVIFLDEIGELAQDIQVKLLRFLESRTFKRVGGTKDIFVDVRIIAASNKDLKQLVEERKFRADLFYRLNVVPLHMPPLRERKEDIVLMAETFLKSFSRTMGKKIKNIDPKLKEVLKEYPWPGNVRELKNLLERMVILSGDRQEVLVVDQLPKDFFKRPRKAGTERINPEAAEYHYQEGFLRDEKGLEEMMMKSELENGKIVLDDILSGIEKKYVGWALKKTRWNISKAADLLGMNRFTLKRKMEQYFPDEQY